MLRGILLSCAVALALSSAAGADEFKVVREKIGEVSPEISFDFKDAKFADVVDFISKQSGCNLVVQGDITDTVTLRLVGVKWRQALDMVCQQIGAVCEDGGNNIIRISKPETINFEVEDASLPKVIGMIARLTGASVNIGPNVKGLVTAQFYDIPWTQALSNVVRSNNYIMLKEGKVIQVMDPATLETQLSTRVFQFRYIQPPETYNPVVESKYVTKGKGAEGVVGVAGVGEVKSVPGLGGLAMGGGAGSPAAGAVSSGSDFPLLNAIQRIASTKGRVDYIPSTNALIVTDTEPNIKAISDLIDSMDKEPLQVFIDVKFVATNLTNTQNRGVNWAKGINIGQTYGKMISGLPFSLGGEYLKKFSVTGQGPTAADVAAGITDYSGSQAGPFKFGLLDFSQMSTVLELLASDQNSELKQSPQLLCLDNRQAMIFVGETIRYAQTDSASNQAGGVQVGIKEADHSPIDTGFQLWVRPHIIAGEDKIMLTVIPKAEQLSGQGSTITGFDDFSNGTATIQLPRVQSSTLVTQLIMKSGQTAVLGGMINENNSKIEHKIPLLGDLPIVGWAFKWKSDLKTKGDLLVFLSVYIVRNDSDQKKIYTVYGSTYGGKVFKGMESDTRLKDWYAPKENGYGVGDNVTVKTATGGY